MTNQIDKLKEELASIEHDRWASWQKYLHSKLKYCEYKDGDKTIACYVMDAGDYEHWSRQIDTDYKDLTEKEKDSDREQVDRYLPLLSQTIDRVQLELLEEITDYLQVDGLDWDYLNSKILSIKNELK